MRKSKRSVDWPERSDFLLERHCSGFVPTNFQQSGDKLAPIINRVPGAEVPPSVAEWAIDLKSESDDEHGYNRCRTKSASAPSSTTKSTRERLGVEDTSSARPVSTSAPSHSPLSKKYIYRCRRASVYTRGCVFVFWVRGTELARALLYLLSQDAEMRSHGPETMCC